MATRFKMVFFVTLGVIMVGCSSLRNQATPTQVSGYKPPLSSLPPTIMLLGTAQPTKKQPSTPLTPSPDLTVEPFPRQTPEAGRQDIQVCTGEGRVISQPPDFGVKGTLVYQKSHYHGLFALGGVPLRLAQLPLVPDQGAYVYGFSPDGKWLAFTPSKDGVVFPNPVIVLLSATGERVEQEIETGELKKELQERCPVCQKFEFYGIAGEWINNKLMDIRLFANGGGDMSVSLPKVFDPFTETWQDHWMDNLPQLSWTLPERITLYDVKLSPDLSRALYPTNPEGIMLRDLTREIEIVSFERGFPFSPKIAWSPDSRMVAVANYGVNKEEQRFLLISRDGEVTNLINNGTPIRITVLTTVRWSPNGQYLAIVGDSDTPPNIYLYDTQINDFIYRCPLLGMVNNVPRLVWSPSSEWIAFSDQPDGSIQLLKVQTGEVIGLLEHAIPVGWSEEFPIEWP